MSNLAIVKSQCVLWPGSLRNGYGAKTINGKTLYAHRLAWESVHGPIPQGLQIDHLCRVRACVNPDHLEPVTQQENIRRGQAGLATGAKQRAKTHCTRGHAYSGTNLGRWESTRYCKACRKISRNRKGAK